MYSGSIFPHTICQSIHEYGDKVWTQGRSLSQPHIHVEYVAFASCKSRTLVWQPLQFLPKLSKIHLHV